jgi:23S rRNA (uridine2552-2'-O)-methyltransferase
MSKNWVMARKRDYYYKKAKRENYRSRAAYKLMQLDERFRIFKPGDSVIDLGASPGGWTQVAAEKVGSTGLVIAVDMKSMDPVENAVMVKGDARSEETISRVKELLPGGQANIIISDMAPNISGNYSLDHARSMELAGMAMRYSDLLLKRGGNAVVKVFDGDMAHDLFRQIQNKFRMAKRHSPKASRKTSSEIYMVGKGKR